MAKWIDCRSEADSEAFTERSEERKGYLLRFSVRRVVPGLSYVPIDPVLWAFLQVGDTRHEPRNDMTMLYLCRDAVRLWRQCRMLENDEAKVGNESSPLPTPGHSPSPTGRNRTYSSAFSGTTPLASATIQVENGVGNRELSVGRCRNVRDQTLARDGDACVVSKLAAAEACHIYPFLAIRKKEPKRVQRFWDVLRMFWQKEKVDAWRSKILQIEGGQPLENMITLTATLHVFFSQAVFALRPIRMTEDKKQLELEFHWLPKQMRSPQQPLNPLELPPSSRNRDCAGRGYRFYYREGTDHARLCTGTQFTMTTDDPKDKPLPDPGLLELQWYLQRVFAISGAAAWKDEDFLKMVDCT